jgi:dTMP kinase
VKRQQQKDRFEQEKSAFFQQIRDCYLQRAANEPDRIKVIDASQSIENIEPQVSALLNNLI